MDIGHLQLGYLSDSRPGVQEYRDHRQLARSEQAASSLSI
jgi:hypothetical protein